MMRTANWPDSMHFWRNKQVIVTGGHGFLGSTVVRKLRARGVAEVTVPLHSQYDLTQNDLTQIEAIRQLLQDTARSGPNDQTPPYHQLGQQVRSS